MVPAVENTRNHRIALPHPPVLACSMTVWCQGTHWTAPPTLPHRTAAVIAGEAEGDSASGKEGEREVRATRDCVCGSCPHGTKPLDMA